MLKKIKNEKNIQINGKLTVNTGQVMFSGEKLLLLTP